MDHRDPSVPVRSPRRRRRQLSTVALLPAGAALALVLAGCGGGSDHAASPASSTAGGSSAPSSSAPASPVPPSGDRVRVVDAQSRFAITVPAGWSVVPDPSRPDALEVSGPTGAAVPDAAAQSAAAAFTQGAKLVTLLPGEAGFAANVNVVLKPAAGLDPADVMQAVPSAAKALEQVGATQVASKALQVDGRPAAQLDYHLTPAGTDVDVTGRVVYLVSDGQAYITTISLGAGDDPSVAADIVSSLRVGPDAVG